MVSGKGRKVGKVGSWIMLSYRSGEGEGEDEEEDSGQVGVDSVNKVNNFIPK